MGPLAFGNPSQLVTALNPLPVDLTVQVNTLDIVKVAGSNISQGHGTAATAIRVELPTDGTGVVNLPAAETHIGEVGTPADVITVTPTVSATPDYTAGDAVGGIQTITAAARASGGKVILQSLQVVDKSNQKKALTILFFDSNPAAATVTDNSAFVFSTDIAKLVGKVNIAAADYETVDSIGIACLKAIGLEMKCSGSANLFAVVVAGEAIDLATTSAYVLKYGFIQG